MYRGHIYKCVAYHENTDQNNRLKPWSEAEIEACLLQIENNVTNSKPGLGTLTGAGRDIWAKVYQ